MSRVNGLTFLFVYLYFPFINLFYLPLHFSPFIILFLFFFFLLLLLSTYLFQSPRSLYLNHSSFTSFPPSFPPVLCKSPFKKSKRGGKSKNNTHTERKTKRKFVPKGEWTARGSIESEIKGR